MNKISEHAATIVFALFLMIGLGYAGYTTFFNTAKETVDHAIENQIQACQKALARSVIFQNFANEAAAARRAQAAEAQAAGDMVAAKNNVATAERYETFAKQWDALTTKNCVEFYSKS